MSRLFDPENKFWNFIGKIADVTCMSFLWVGTSLPLVTMGAATTAFYSYTMHQVRDTEGGILSGYFKAFRHNFKKATLLWLLEVAGLAFFAADLVGVWNLFLFLGGLPAILVGALVLCLAFLFLGCTFYIWPLLAVFEFPLKKLLTNSFVMAVGNLPVTLTLVLVWALAGVGCFYLQRCFLRLGGAGHLCLLLLCGHGVQKVHRRAGRGRSRLEAEAGGAPPAAEAPEK